MATDIILEVRDLTWMTGHSQVLSGISFDLGRGTILACLGPNGAGKTSLLNLLSGWAIPSSGSISICGAQRLRLTPESAYRFGITRRFDPPKLIGELTVLDNLCLAATPDGDAGILAAFLARRRIAGTRRAVRTKAMPLLRRFGIDDKLQTVARNLSVGEQKLLDLTIGLMSGTRCLLLDEPLKDRVDAGRRDAVARELRQFANEGGSALVVEHDLAFVRDVADRLLVLDRNGRLIWDGFSADPETWNAVERAYQGATIGAPTQRDTTNSESKRQTTLATKSVQPRLSVSRIAARYDGATVLQDASFTLARGEIAILRGENGAGKSTLLFALAGLVRASGAVHLDGHDITSLAAHERAKKGLLLVAQEHKVFPSMTVAENMLVGYSQNNTARKHLFDRALGWFPELRRKLSQTATQLSAGQKQMVALARVLLQHPKCLLLDEPMSGLDAGLRQRVSNLIRELANDGTSILLVEHVREAIDLAIDSTYFLHGGRLLRADPSNTSALHVATPVRV